MRRWACSNRCTRSDMAPGYRYNSAMRHWLLGLLFVPVIARADDVASRAQKLHSEAIVVDTHLDAPDQLSTKWADVGEKGATDHFDIPRARAGGLTAPFFSIYVAA